MVGGDQGGVQVEDELLLDIMGGDRCLDLRCRWIDLLTACVHESATWLRCGFGAASIKHGGDVSDTFFIGAAGHRQHGRHHLQAHGGPHRPDLERGRPCYYRLLRSDGLGQHRAGVRPRVGEPHPCCTYGLESSCWLRSLGHVLFQVVSFHPPLYPEDLKVLFPGWWRRIVPGIFSTLSGSLIYS